MTRIPNATRTTLISAIGAAALAVACGPEPKSPPDADDAGASSCTGGSSDTGGSATGGSETGGSSTSPWGGRSGSGGSGVPVCNMLENIGTEVHPVADPAPIPEMTGGTIVDGTYVLTSLINYAGADASPDTLKATNLFTENGATVQQVTSWNGHPDAHSTLTQMPSGNTLNASATCPETAPSAPLPYTATRNSLSVLAEPAPINLVVTFTRPDCVSSFENIICAPSGFPFVKRAFAVSETCPGVNCHPPNPNLTQPETGTLCLSGTAPEAGHALRLPVFVGNQDGSEVVAAFDADALGITQVSFTLDSPPASGMSMNASSIVPNGCTGYIFDCLASGFWGPLITESGTTTVRLTRFTQSDPESPNQTFDTSSISGIGFTVGEGPYDFCIRDFKFLDDAGDEVTP